VGCGESSVASACYWLFDILGAANQQHAYNLLHYIKVIECFRLSQVNQVRKCQKATKAKKQNTTMSQKMPLECPVEYYANA